VNSVIPTDYNFLVININDLTITSVGNVTAINSRDKEKSFLTRHIKKKLIHAIVLLLFTETKSLAADPSGRAV
jgi:hypothetical protein